MVSQPNRMQSQERIDERFYSIKVQNQNQFQGSLN